MELNLCGLSCPLPVVRTREAWQKLSGGEELRLVVDSPVAKENVLRFLENSGGKVEKVEEKDGVTVISVRK
ncbi:MAG: tRNA 2-thiouridine synthesizing protein [Eubacteriales bacterium]|nr:tRNA 2-thiouridine synthesizing protein [Eubacteriales bacterium]MDN5364523.1 tRNA 2-thiouridine synthesizing protein [Eubacteriales bacterium]